MENERILWIIFVVRLSDPFKEPSIWAFSLGLNLKELSTRYIGKEQDL